MIVGEDFERAIVIDVAHREASRRMHGGDSGAGLRGDVGEAAVAEIVVKNRALAEAQVGVFFVDLREDVAIDHGQVEPAIVVEIEELATPAHIAGVGAHAGGDGSLLELAFAFIVV